MRSISTTTGKQIPLDGDLLAILETLFHEITAKVIEGGSYEDMNREINHLVSQLSDEDLRAYLTESIFLNQVKYENDRLEQYIKKLGKKDAGGKSVRE
jgi:phage gp29-like protein